jgi:hypothetical protein
MLNQALYTAYWLLVILQASKDKNGFFYVDHSWAWIWAVLPTLLLVYFAPMALEEYVLLRFLGPCAMRTIVNNVIAGRQRLHTKRDIMEDLSLKNLDQKIALNSQLSLMKARETALHVVHTAAGNCTVNNVLVHAPAHLHTYDIRPLTSKLAYMPVHLHKLYMPLFC